MRTLLATLLLARSRIVSDSRIAAMLWGEHPPATSEAQIQIYVSRLRQKLGVPIIRQRPGYLLEVDPGRLDLAEFERLTRDGRRLLDSGSPREAGDVLTQALALWRGPALAGATDLLTDAERPQLEEAKLATLEDRIDADLAVRKHAELVPELTGLVALHPWRERLRGQLMLALYRSGRQAEAVSAYEELRQLLTDDLSIDPGSELRELFTRVLAADPALGPPAAEEPARLVATAPTRPAQLPRDIADFTGREDESAYLSAMLLRRRQPDAPATGCVISGMAGVGKTELAVHVAHQCQDSYPDGQLYVDLSGLSAQPVSPFDALGTMLRSLGVDGAVIPPTLDERVKLYRSRLIRQRVLVLLDNASSEQQVRPLLPTGRECGVLVTGRARLAALHGVPILDLDVLERGQALTLLGRIVGEGRMRCEPEEAGRLVELCGYLPLSIRIAGARLAAKPYWRLAQLVKRLDVQHRRLDELRIADTNVRASLIQSYQVLTSSARRAFHLLALLDVPNFALWTAAVVLDEKVADARDLVEQLVDARLLDSIPAASGMADQYRFHDLVRTLALERAAAEEPPRERRAALTRALGGSSWPSWTGLRNRTWATCG
ncbi:BTAD domain-containing putative transcriptional regulator [Nonomuraea angiospora]|uniref:AfsR/SARP family transcriptional regulator n=1 Tax=Nonomuraea angiospora TaxID=46172 RepID=UPI0034226457